MMDSAELQVGRLRSRVPAAMSDISWRLQLERWMNNASFIPADLPPSSLLFVQKITGRISGIPAGRATRLLSHATRQEALREELARLLRNAARPQCGQLSTNADAVLFADESEMLACLALALANGDYVRQWWWRYVLRRLVPGVVRSLAALLQGQARQLPAVFAHLINWRKIRSVIEVLTFEETFAVIQALETVHGAGIGVSGLADDAEVYPPSENSRASAPIEGTGDGLVGHRRASAFPPPWRRWLPAEEAQFLEPLQELLVGLGLALHYQPSQTRSHFVAAQTRAWWRDKAVCGREPEAKSDKVLVNQEVGRVSDSVTRQDIDEVGLRATNPNFDAVGWAEIPNSTSEPSQQSIGWVDDRSLTSEQDRAREVGVSSSPQPAGLTDTPDSNRAQTSNPNLIPTEKNQLQSDSSSSEKANEKTITIEHWASDGMQTRLGGALYLINLMRYLDLPACFEPSWGLASRLGAWGLLDLLARALLGDLFDEFSDDPFWQVLAELDNREARAWPGEDFVGSEFYRIPESWFEGVTTDQDAFFWDATDSRLRLWSNMGFLVIDAVRGKAEACEQAHIELSRYSPHVRLSEGNFPLAPVEELTHDMNRHLKPSLRLWLASATPYLRFRLRQAMGNGFTNERDLLVMPGRVFVTVTHIDLVASLESISLPVRLAGLDRDPGWVPNLGRVVLFHFQ